MTVEAIKPALQSEHDAREFLRLRQAGLLSDAKRLLSRSFASIPNPTDEALSIGVRIFMDLASAFVARQDELGSLEALAEGYSLAKRSPRLKPLQFQVLVASIQRLMRPEQLPQAIPLLRDALQLSLELYGGADRRTLLVRSLLASALSQTGPLEEALQQQELVVAEHMKLLGPADPVVLQHEFALGRLLVDSPNRRSEGIALLRRVYEDSGRVHGRSSQATLTVGMSLFMSLHLYGDSREAHLLAEQIDRLSSEALLPEKLLWQFRSFRASLLGRAGRFAEALEIIENGLTQLQGRSDGPAREQRAHLLRNKCSILNEASRSDVALCAEALTAYQALGAQEPGLRTLLVHEIAIAHINGGRPATAVRILEPEVLGLKPDKMSQLNRDNLDLTLARAYTELGRLPEAWALLEALRGRLLANGDSATSLGASVTVAAARLLRMADRRKEHSALMVSEAPALLRHAAPVDVIHVKYEYAEALSSLGRHVEATKLARESYLTARELFGDLSNPTTRSFAEQFVSLSKRSAGTLSSELFDLATALHDEDRKQFGPTSPTALLSGMRLVLLTPPSRSENLIRDLGRVLDDIESWRESAPLLSQERVHWWGTFVHMFALASALPDPRDQSSKRWDLQFTISERSKTSARFEAIALQRHLRLVRAPDEDVMVLNRLAKQIAELDVTIAETRNLTERVQRLHEKSRLETSYESTATRVLAKIPEAQRMALTGRVTPGDVARHLTSDELFITFTFDEGGYGAAFSIDASARVERHRIELGEGLARSVEAAIEYLDGLRPGRRDSRKLWRLEDGSYRIAGSPKDSSWAPVPSPRELFAYLGRVLLAPSIATSASKTKLVISLDGPLWRLPFELLELDGLRVVDRFDVAYAPSAAMFQLVRQQQRSPPPSGSWQLDLVAFGAPEFSSTSSSMRSPMLGRGGGKEGVAESLRLEGNPKNGSIEWDSLPGTLKEVQLVSSHFEPSKTLVLTGKDASERRLKALDKSGTLRSTRFLLFSTHGYVSGANPETNSVILAGANDPSDTDGYLSALEIASLDLGSKLVVLSACDSARGPYRLGEGVANLASAVTLAGGGGALVTLWPIADEMAASFISMFFRNLRDGVDASRALALTKRNFMKARGTSDPFYWAPFVLIGG